MASAVVEDFSRTGSRRGTLVALALALAALYGPTYVSFAQGTWRDDAYAHGPIILLVAAWLAWRERSVFLSAEAKPAPWTGGALFVAGLVLHVIGRAFGIAVFEGASHMPVFAGLVLMAGGFAAARSLAFALLLLVFVIPLPGFVLDAVTTPLKAIVSAAVAAILESLGYPVVRSGVVLDVAGHPMLVADACSGLNSIFSLVALALVYAHVTPPRSRLRMAALLAAIVPIAVAANIMRVTVLVLVTLQWGEEVAQGFVHGLAGMLVFLVALALLIAFDGIVRRFARRDAPTPVRNAVTRARPVRFALLQGAAVAMLAASAAAFAMKPVAVASPVDLERIVPATFGAWHAEPQSAVVAPTPDVQASLDRLYRQVLSRTYVNAAGDRMMLILAYGGDQSDALKAHRQEKCYEAQGFRITGLEPGVIDVAGRRIPVTRMVATLGARVEPVTYWFTMGDRVVLGRGERLRAQVVAGLAGHIPDGMLVRISSLSPDPARAFTAQQAFATALFERVAVADSVRFVGAKAS